MLPVGSDRRHDLVAVSSLNQYLYCKRRYWYYRFFDAGDRSPDFVAGNARHREQARQSDQYREQYYVAPEIGLHGKIDILDVEATSTALRPVERKRASGGRYYWNDEIQLAGYCLLLEAATDMDSVDTGYIYLYSTDERHEITITEQHREEVLSIVDEIHNMEPDDPPPLVDNPNKCGGCSVRFECLPATTSRMESGTAESSDWNEVDPHG